MPKTEKHNLKSKCQSKSVRKTKQLTYDQTKETNRIKDKKIEKIADFFCQILQCDFFGCFDAIIRCDIFPKKTWDAMRFSMRCDCHPCSKPLIFECFSITLLCLNAVPNLICILLRICVCKFNRLIIVLDHFLCNSQIITYR